MTYNTENEKGYMAQNPGIVPIHFAEGEGFKQEVAANVGCRKGSDKLLKLIDKTLKALAKRSATKCGTRASIVSRHKEAA